MNGRLLLNDVLEWTQTVAGTLGVNLAPDHIQSGTPTAGDAIFYITPTQDGDPSYFHQLLFKTRSATPSACEYVFGGNADQQIAIVCDTVASVSLEAGVRLEYDATVTNFGSVSTQGTTYTHKDSGKLRTLYEGTEALNLDDERVETKGGRVVGVDRYTANQTLTATNHHVFGDTDGGAFTISLPAGVAGTHYRIVNTGSSGNALTVSPNGAELLLGANSNFVLNDGDALIIVYDATEGWF